MSGSDGQPPPSLHPNWFGRCLSCLLHHHLLTLCSSFNSPRGHSAPPNCLKALLKAFAMSEVESCTLCSPCESIKDFCFVIPILPVPFLGLFLRFQWFFLLSSMPVSWWRYPLQPQDRTCVQEAAPSSPFYLRHQGHFRAESTALRSNTDIPTVAQACHHNEFRSRRFHSDLSCFALSFCSYLTPQQNIILTSPALIPTQPVSSNLLKAHINI